MLNIRELVVVGACSFGLRGLLAHLGLALVGFKVEPAAHGCCWLVGVCRRALGLESLSAD